MPKHGRLWYQVRNARHAGEGETPGTRWRATNEFVLKVAYYQQALQLNKTELAKLIDVYPEMVPEIQDGHALNVDGAYLTMDEWQDLAEKLSKQAILKDVSPYEP